MTSRSFFMSFHLVSGATDIILYPYRYDRELYPPGSNCVGPQGFAVAFDETIDLNSTIVTGGGGIDETMLPLFKTNWGTCAPVYPWDFVRVNSKLNLSQTSTEIKVTERVFPSGRCLRSCKVCRTSNCLL